MERIISDKDDRRHLIKNYVCDFYVGRKKAPRVKSNPDRGKREGKGVGGSWQNLRC